MRKKIEDYDKKYLTLANTNVLNTKIGEVENKIPGHAKYISTHEFNELAWLIFDPKLDKQNLKTNNDVNIISKRANNNEEKKRKF